VTRDFKGWNQIISGITTQIVPFRDRARESERLKLEGIKGGGEGKKSPLLSIRGGKGCTVPSRRYVCFLFLLPTIITVSIS
jgi:hypothetical protein